MKISITGDLGSGKSTIAKLLSNKLNYEYIYTGLLHRKIAEKFQVDSLELNKMAFENSQIDDEIDNYLKSLNNSENIIIDSRLAWHFIKDNFKIYFEINPEVSAERILNDKSRFNEPKYRDKESAKKIIFERKVVEDKRFLMKYNVNCNDLTNFDIVINTTVGTSETICDLLINLIKLKENGISFPKIWINSKFLYPTEDIRLIGRDEAKMINQNVKENGFDFNFPIECVNYHGYYLIWDGHKRYSAALLNKIEYVPIKIIAQDGQEIYKGLTVSNFAKTHHNESRYYDWEDAHGFHFILYPQ